MAGTHTASLAPTRAQHIEERFCQTWISEELGNRKACTFLREGSRNRLQPAYNETESFLERCEGAPRWKERRTNSRAATQ
ncbi:hypothetical protein CapIbe_009811 [Capra ibex]